MTKPRPAHKIRLTTAQGRNLLKALVYALDKFDGDICRWVVYHDLLADIQSQLGGLEPFLVKIAA